MLVCNPTSIAMPNYVYPFILVLCYVTLNAALSTLTSQPNPKRESVKVLVLGSSGRLGREVVRELSAMSRDEGKLGNRKKWQQ